MSDIWSDPLSISIFHVCEQEGSGETARICFEGRIWDLIVSVSDHCLSFYFAWAFAVAYVISTIIS